MQSRISRRDALRILSGLVCCGTSIFVGELCAQTPGPPAPPGLGQPQTDQIGSDKTTVELESFEEWMRQLGEAAKEIVSETGQELTEADLKRVDSTARGVLNDKGLVVPLPPSNLRIE